MTQHPITLRIGLIEYRALVKFVAARFDDNMGTPARYWTLNQWAVMDYYQRFGAMHERSGGRWEQLKPGRLRSLRLRTVDAVLLWHLMQVFPVGPDGQLLLDQLSGHLYTANLITLPLLAPLPGHLNRVY